VLLPGLFGAAYGFRQILPALAERGYRAMVIEPLGMGHSAKPERGNYSLTAQADRIATAMERLGARGAIVVAHSVAASMALRAAYRHPGTVAGLVSLEGGPAESAATRNVRRASRFVPWVKWLGGIKRIRKAMYSGLIKSSGDTTWVTEEVVLGYTAGAAADIDGSLMAFLAVAAAREPEKLAPRLKEITVPVVLLLGGADHDGAPGKEEIERMRASLPHFSVDSVPGAGLYLHEERPDAVIAAIIRMVEAVP
jgi:pimeloyl-ACP methyl ester carboxylesterase